MFAPELYRRIVPITRDLSGRLAIDGEGQIVEWAVEMSRFDENQTLDRIADANGIDDQVAQELAATAIAMHARVPAVDGASWIAALDDFLEQNAAAFRETPDLFDAGLAAELDKATRSQYRPIASFVRWNVVAAAWFGEGTAICILAISLC